MLVAPFDHAVVDIIAVDDALAIGIRQNQTRRAQPVGRIIALKKVIAFNHMAAARHHTEMAEPHRPVVTDLGVIGVHIERD